MAGWVEPSGRLVTFPEGPIDRDQITRHTVLDAPCTRGEEHAGPCVYYLKKERGIVDVNLQDGDGTDYL